MNAREGLAEFEQRAVVSVAFRSLRLVMRAAGLAQLLDDRPADALRWSPVTLWTLYRHVRARRPHAVVELGTGCSTVIIGEALRRNGAGHLISVDANARWLGETEKNLPPALRPFVTLLHSPVLIEEIDGEPCHRFSLLPDQSLDFLYVDGPGPKDVPGWQGKVVAADPIHLEARFNPGFRMVVDKRSRNVTFLRRHLRRSYRVGENRRFGLTRFELLDQPA
jgi:hypothetical protein